MYRDVYMGDGGAATAGGVGIGPMVDNFGKGYNGGNGLAGGGDIVGVGDFMLVHGPVVDNSECSFV